MQQYQIDIIKNTFNRCWGLRELVKQLSPNGIKELSFQTGMREQFIIDNIKDIF